MEGSIKENPSKFGIRDKMFFGSMLIPETLSFFLTGRVSRIMRILSTLLKKNCLIRYVFLGT